MRNEPEAIRTDIRIARLVTGLVLGTMIGIIMLVGNAIAAKPAAAQDVLTLWKERHVVVEALAESFAEAPRALGITADGAVLELFTADDGATWTIMITLPNGKSRVIATGEHWITRPLLAKGQVS